MDNYIVSGIQFSIKAKWQPCKIGQRVFVTNDSHFCRFLSRLEDSFRRYFASVFSCHVNVKILQYNCSLVGVRNLDRCINEKKVICNYRTINLYIVMLFKKLFVCQIQ